MGFRSWGYLRFCVWARIAKKPSNEHLTNPLNPLVVHVSNSRKINQLLDFCCQDVLEILDANRERAAAFLTEHGPYADGFVDFAKWALDNDESRLELCIDASSFSD